MKTISIIFFLLCASMSCSKKGGSQNSVTPKMTFGDVTLTEGTGGTKNAELTLTLDQATSKQVTVTYSTVDGIAKAGADFTGATDQLVTFQPNETQKTILISIVTDDLKEGEETFQVRVKNPVNVILLKETVTVTLQNDDTRIGFNNTGYDAPTSYPGYTLAWSDEFNGTSLDMTAWSAETGDGCPALCGWGNNEQQYYTNPPNNLFFQDGKMIIEAKAESFGGKNYTSARIKTQNKKSFKYGRIDIRAILPKGSGIWPAFWLLPQTTTFGNWPTSGEIDMMELKGGQPSNVLGTLHYGPGPGSTYISRNFTLPTGNFNDQFHVFSLEWKQDQIKWLVDDNVFSTINKVDIGSNTWPFNELFYLLINFAVGGNFPGPVDANTVFPSWLIVDYLRVYQN